ncbi:hypothetical protein GCM10020000_01090 [Streptomyces olivoverticillatus]
MAADLTAVEAIAEPTEAERHLLTGPRAPVVLLRRAAAPAEGTPSPMPSAPAAPTPG